MKHIKKSLQTLKLELANKETLLKIIHNHYPHLSGYTQKELLDYFNLSTFDELGNYIQSSVKTFSEERNDDDTHCSCQDGNGEYKELYDTDELAQEQAARSIGVKLKVYPCPYGYGWHLTKG